MPISRKCQYAVRAVFELAKRYGEGPVKIQEIAKAQAIPAQFLEGILSVLKQSGFLASVRGQKGGYALSRAPGEITFGEVVRFIEGPLHPVDCNADGASPDCPLGPDCVFLAVWREAEAAVSAVYDSLTFGELLAREERLCQSRALDYVI
jgi:Rrf2 family transcriptional regulator, cysteine metabolism repressor